MFGLVIFVFSAGNFFRFSVGQFVFFEIFIFFHFERLPNLFVRDYDVDFADDFGVELRIDCIRAERFDRIGEH